MIYDISNEVWGKALAAVIDRRNAFPSSLLSIPGIYEILSEYYNNDVIDEVEADRENE